MKTSLNWIVIGTGMCGGLGLAASAILFSQAGNTHGAGAPSAKVSQPARSPSLQTSSIGEPAPTGSDLDAALSETDPAHRQALLEQWADSVDLQAMADLLTKADGMTPNPKLKAEIRAALLTSWGKRDLGGALAWFGPRNGADHLQEQARDLLVQAMNNRDPVQMFAWMQGALPNSARKELYGPFFRQWALTDPAAAANQLNQMATPSLGNVPFDPGWNDLLGQVAVIWANANLDQAVTWVQALPEGAGKSQALLQVSSRWTEVEPQAAATYAAQQNDPALFQVVAGKWAETAPAEAAQWLETLPQNHSRDVAVTAYTNVIGDSSPDQAFQWAESITDESLRNQQLQNIAEQWLQKDRVAARAQITQSNLPPELKTALLANDAGS